MSSAQPAGEVQALMFDVFGTVVDWRSSIIAEGRAFAEQHGLQGVDWEAFTDAWRGRYQPQLSRVRDGEIGWTKLDDLHRESLLGLLDEFGITGLEEAAIEHLNRVWHRLHPWPDALEGLRRLHTRYVLATCSNGNVSLMVHLARFSGLPWDAILGAEPTRAYKPQPAAYLGSADMLSLPPQQVMMVAAHNYDLKAARTLGFRTAFVPRPAEYGPHQRDNLEPMEAWDVVADSFTDLAARLGC